MPVHSPRMVRRPPVTLWLYILTDLWKLVLLTTGVLVTVIAFAAAVKPLADGRLGPEDTLRLMFFAMVPMLQYALPFAACFAATLAYHRIASDNELTACFAGGISHRTILVPALLSGLALSVILLALSNYTIPRFLRYMSEIVTEDVTRLMVSSIERGEAIEMSGGTYIYADTVVPQGPDPESGVQQRLWLGGLLVVRLDEKGEVQNQGSAKSAAVWLRRSAGGRGMSDDPMTEVIIRPTDFVGLGPTTRGMGAEAVMTFLIPNAFRDNPKFLSFSELRQLRTSPENIDEIDKHRRALALAMAERDLIASVREGLRSKGRVELLDPFDQKIVLRASDLRPTRGADSKRDPGVMQIVPAVKGHPVVIEKTLSDGKVQRQSAASAFLRLPREPDPQRRSVSASLQLLDVSAQAVGPDGEVDAPPDEPPSARGEVKERPLADLRLAGDSAAKILDQPSAALQAIAQNQIALRPADADLLNPPLNTLRAKIDDLLREVVSKEQERFAASAACLVMVLIGAVMAMRLREALPLMVYLWAFFPALATVLAISGGQQLMHKNGLAGLPLLWGGVVALASLVFVQYGRLVRH